MEKSRTSNRVKQVKFFTIVFILGSLYLIGCGQHSKIDGVLALGSVPGQADFVDEGTPAVEERPYLALTPDDEASTIKKYVPENAGNKEFASQIVTASINRVGTGAEVEIQTTKSSIPLQFKGELTPSGLTYTGNFPESSKQHPDLVLYVSCNDQACRHADLFLSDNQGHKAAIVVSTEDRILHTTIPDGETEDQIKKFGLEQFAQDTKVHYNLTETFPGQSHYTVTSIEADPKNSKVIFDGPIQNAPDGLAPAQSAVLGKTETVSLAGVDADNLILNIASTPDPKKPEESANIIANVRAQDNVTVRPKTHPSKNPPPITNVPECNVKLTGEVNPMVKDILKECNKKRIIDGTNWWKTKNPRSYNNFMRVYQGSKTATVASQFNDFKDFKIMVDLLHSQNFPTVWSWVTEVEAAFDNLREGRSGELGVWQIKPSTRTGLHMTDLDAKAIGPATKGAMTLYRPLVNKYTHNIPLILAGYNRGEPGIQVLINSGVSEDFWYLCTMSLKGESKKQKASRFGTCDYVSKIISGMITSLDPAAFGMPNIGAMEAK